MRRFGKLVSILVAGTLAGSASQAQQPRIVVLPDNDFVYDWGRENTIDNRERPDFSIIGTEQKFRCNLSGSFRPNSRYNDRFVIREMEESLITTPYFVQASVQLMNQLEESIDIQWAVLDCRIPESLPDEEQELREREREALERARRAQERRREREED